MTLQERDELRAKHRRNANRGCATCQDYSWNDDYPCDTIKVLDAWEAERRAIVRYIDLFSVRSSLQVAAIRSVLTGENDALETQQPSLQERLRAKHVPVEQHRGRIGVTEYCEGCKGPNGVLAVVWPCEVVQLLDEVKR